MESIWKKFEIMKESYGELTKDDLPTKLGIDLDRLSVDLG
jgi:hypothetical protein